MRDLVLGAGLGALLADVGLPGRVERDADAREEGGVVGVVLAVAIEVGDGGDVGGIGLVEAVVAVLVEAGELAEGRARLLREAAGVVARGGEDQCERNGE